MTCAWMVLYGGRIAKTVKSASMQCMPRLFQRDDLPAGALGVEAGHPDGDEHPQSCGQQHDDELAPQARREKWHRGAS